MKKRTKGFLIAGICIIGVALLSAIPIVLLSGALVQDTFDSIVKSELFTGLPMMTGKEVTYTVPEDVGGDNELLWVRNSTKEESESYLKLLEKQGYVKHSDNGEDGIEGYVYTSNFQKGDLLVAVSYYPRIKETSIELCAEDVFSDHLIYNDSYVEDNIPGFSTKFIMPELYSAGNSFVIQLKNGHFIVNDGGTLENIFYLFDLLDSLSPNGQKPVIDAWIVSHSHSDHMDVLRALTKRPELAERVAVEGVYFTPACDAANEERRGTVAMMAYTMSVKTARLTRRDSYGEPTAMYRMREGERYYFSDITMDVLFALDILNYKEWKTSNAQSTILMYTIDEQKVLIPADADYECQKKMLEIFDDAYFDLAVYQLPHHGGNTYNEITKHFTYKTLLNAGRSFSTAASSLLSRLEQQQYAISKSEEHMAWGEGGVVLTFPYTVGTYERLPMVDWESYQTDIDTLMN